MFISEFNVCWMGVFGSPLSFCFPSFFWSGWPGVLVIRESSGLVGRLPWDFVACVPFTVLPLPLGHLIPV